MMSFRDDRDREDSPSGDDQYGSKDFGGGKNGGDGSGESARIQPRSQQRRNQGRRGKSWGRIDGDGNATERSKSKDRGRDRMSGDDSLPNYTPKKSHMREDQPGDQTGETNHYKGSKIGFSRSKQRRNSVDSQKKTKRLSASPSQSSSSLSSASASSPPPSPTSNCNDANRTSRKRISERRRTRDKFTKLLIRNRGREALRLAHEADWQPTIYDLNEILTRLTKEKLIGVAMEIIREAETTWKLLPPKNLKTATLLIDVYGKAKMLDKAIRTFEFIESMESDQMNSISFNALVAACARCNRVDLSFAVIEKMRARGLQPDKFTFSSIIDALGKTGDVEKAFEVADLMEQEGIEMDQASYSALIDACGRAGRLETALLLFEDMKNHGVWPNVITFAVIIEACAGAMEPDKAFEIFRELRQWNIKPNVVIYTCLLDACCKARRMDKAEEVLMDMRANGIAPNTVTYGSFIHGYCLAGDLDSAFGTIEAMIQDQCAPSPKLVQSLLHFCRASNRLDLVEVVWNLHKHFPQSLSPSFFLKLMSMMAQMGDAKLGLEIARHAVKEYPHLGGGLRRSLTRAFGELLDLAEETGDEQTANGFVHLLHAVESDRRRRNSNNGG